MLIDTLFLVIGLAMILVGANCLTDGSSAIAKRFGLSDLVVGLTVVAFGTSTPEFVISLMSAIDGNAGLAIGNVVGSNIFNILGIIGITALVRPMPVERGVMSKELPMVVLSSVVLLVMGNGKTLDGAEDSILSRVDGIILLMLFAIFMRMTFAGAKNATAGDPVPGINDTKTREMPVWKATLWVVAGLAMLIFGGDRFVAGATGIAQKFGVSDSVIGLTIAAIGTSLPELATSIAAAVKGKPGMAIGNVIGSNIFNIFLILGATATISPMKFGNIGNLDLLVLTGASILFLIFGQFIGQRTITRPEGAIMTTCYIGYMAALLATQI